MSVPLSPYAVTSDVALLFRNNRIKEDFTVDSVPNKLDVTRVIDMVTSHIHIVFTSVGYKIPFAVLTGETWPDHQTEYLRILTVLGAVDYITNRIIKPNAKFVDTERVTVISEAVSYSTELKMIKETLPFRADYYYGTQAEQRLLEPFGFSNNVLSGITKDPTGFESLLTVTNRLYFFQEAFASKQVRWDYLEDLL